MTAQVSDVIWYKAEEYSVADVKGEGLFDPEAHGIKPVVAGSACYLGYVATYTVKDGLLLKELAACLRNSPDEPPPPVPPALNGVEAELNSDEHAMFDCLYKGIGMPVKFTGGILVARDFIEELYEHMGVQSAWKFRKQARPELWAATTVPSTGGITVSGSTGGGASPVSVPLNAASDVAAKFT